MGAFLKRRVRVQGFILFDDYGPYFSEFQPDSMRGALCEDRHLWYTNSVWGVYPKSCCFRSC
jgi:NADPH-dependent curcumin reductase CurA